jgi:transposase-like protein
MDTSLFVIRKCLMRRSTESTTERHANQTFSAEFKQEAVELIRRYRTEGVSLSHVARELDIGGIAAVGVGTEA